MRGLVTSARAIAMRWRWPPDRLPPRSLDDGVVAVRQLEDELVRAGELGRRDHRSIGMRRDRRARCCRGSSG